MKEQFLLLGLGFLAITGFASGPVDWLRQQPMDGPRLVLNKDFDWRFHQGEVDGAQAERFDDTSWRLLDLPHDWSIEGDYDKNKEGGHFVGYLPKGIGWYRKSFDIPEEWLAKRVSLLFDGVFMDSTVWLNGHKVGGRPYGYISFECDLSAHLKPGRNVVAVRVDNSLQPSARWYTGSGIYGSVRLMVTEPVHLRLWGTFVQTPEVANDRASVRVIAEIANDGNNAAEGTVRFEIRNPRGENVAKGASEWKAALNSTSTVSVSLPVLNPERWSPDAPALYSLVSELIRGGTVVDRTETSFGIRKLAWSPETGLMLNGMPTKLHGVCNHLAAGMVGAAVPPGLHARRLALLKDMGVNAIRTAHYPQVPEFYHLCDRLGIMVVNEFNDGWDGKTVGDYGRRFFQEWWRRDIADWVRRDRNHPSVILWSLGNETGWEDKYEMSPEIKKHDPTRLTTGGTMSEGVDVAGFNGPSGVPGWLDKWRKENPGRVMINTEEPHTLQTRGYYRSRTWWRDRGAPRFEIPNYADEEIFSHLEEFPQYKSSYDNAAVRQTARTSLLRTRTLPWLCGEFRWTGYDYLGESSFVGGWPARHGDFGIIDLAMIPKDHYYLYQSAWSEKPMLHLLPHWTHPGLEGRPIPIVAYSNGDEVELFLNGHSLGRQRPSALGDFHWDVAYIPGEIRGVAYRAGMIVAEASVRTAGQAQRIDLESDNSDLAADRRDLAHVIFRIADDAGNTVPTAMDRVEFKTIGPVRLLGFENGDMLDHTRAGEPWRKAFNGMGAGLFQATSDSGPVELVGAGILGPRGFAEKTSVAIDCARISLRGPLSPADFEIFYTLNGTEPTAQSLRFCHPFEIRQTTRVRAVLLRAGQPFLHLQEDFVERPDPKRPDTSGQTEDKGFEGPFDKELVGDWREGDQTFRFKSDGRFYAVIGGEESLAGWWWYDYPDDRFEAQTIKSKGRGELRWAYDPAVTAKIELLDLGASRMRSTQEHVIPSGRKFINYRMFEKQ